MLMELLLLLCIWWAILSLTCYKSLQKIFRKYKNMLRLDTPQNYNAFLRMDFDKWDQKTLLRRSYTVFPARFTIFFSFMSTYAVLAVLHKYLKFPAFLIDLFRRTYGAFALKFCFKIINNYDPNQEIDTPIIVSNHVTWIDIIYFGSILKSRVSFVAKRQIASMPIIRQIASFLQAIIVDRRSPESRQKTIQDIRDRVDNFSKDPKNFFPIVIFPEGTVSNGRSLMQFKNGAFDPLSAITLFTLRYQSQQFHIGDNQMDQYQNILLSFCANCSLRVDKERIFAKKDQTVEQYRQRCRERVSEMGKFKRYDVGIKDFFKYTQDFNKQLKQRKEKGA